MIIRPMSGARGLPHRGGGSECHPPHHCYRAPSKSVRKKM